MRLFLEKLEKIESILEKVDENILWKEDQNETLNFYLVPGQNRMHFIISDKKNIRSNFKLYYRSDILKHFFFSCFIFYFSDI